MRRLIGGRAGEVQLLKKISSRLAIALLLAGLLWAPVTGAWFRDEEVSANNKLASATLDAVLTSADADFVPTLIKAGEKTSRLFTVRNAGMIPFAYELKPNFGIQSNPLCDNLLLTFYRIEGASKTEISSGLLDPLLSHEYVVEASLPTDTGLELINLNCPVELDLLAAQPEFAPEKVGFWDEEGLTNLITSGDWTPNVCSDIRGYKRDDAGEGLKDWEIVILPESVAPIETVTIMANNMDGAATTTVLDENKVYVVDVENNDEADEEILLMNGLEVTGMIGLVLRDQADSLLFSIKEPEETDDGGFFVRIYEVTDSVVKTNKDGYYSKEVCEPGDYRIMEVPQNGWEQISPASSSYKLTLPVDREFTFVNKEKPVKILINEVFYDVDESHGSEDKENQSDEWVELYNPNDFPVNIKKWGLIDDDGETKVLSNRNAYIPAHGFAFIAKAAETFKYWPSVPDNAIRIEVGKNLGDKLGNDGDRLILKDSLDNEVDKVSWGTDTTAFNPAVTDVAEGHSIQRKELGLDTDTANDWENDPLPNPGTNPHTHFMVKTLQVKNDLVIDFSNAVGFDRVKYALSYDRLNEEGEVIPDKVAESEATKPVTQLTLTLDPITLSTCSEVDGVIVCVPHLGVTNGKVSLMYYLDDSVLGTSLVPFSWTDTE